MRTFMNSISMTVNTRSNNNGILYIINMSIFLEGRVTGVRRLRDKALKRHNLSPHMKFIDGRVAVLYTRVRKIAFLQDFFTCFSTLRKSSVACGRQLLF